MQYVPLVSTILISLATCNDIIVIRALFAQFATLYDHLPIACLLTISLPLMVRVIRILQIAPSISPRFPTKPSLLFRTLHHLPICSRLLIDYLPKQSHRSILIDLSCNFTCCSLFLFLLNHLVIGLDAPWIIASDCILFLLKLVIVMLDWRTLLDQLYVILISIFALVGIRIAILIQRWLFASCSIRFTIVIPYWRTFCVILVLCQVSFWKHCV